MSHAYGRVLSLPDRQLIGHFEYNGTSDCACSTIFATKEELGAVLGETWLRPQTRTACPALTRLTETDTGRRNQR